MEGLPSLRSVNLILISRRYSCRSGQAQPSTATRSTPSKTNELRSITPKQAPENETNSTQKVAWSPFRVGRYRHPKNATVSACAQVRSQHDTLNAANSIHIWSKIRAASKQEVSKVHPGSTLTETWVMCRLGTWSWCQQCLQTAPIVRKKKESVGSRMTRSLNWIRPWKTSDLRKSVDYWSPPRPLFEMK